MTDPLADIGEASYMPYFGLRFPQVSVERLNEIYEILCRALPTLEGEPSIVELKRATPGSYHKTNPANMRAEPNGDYVIAIQYYSTNTSDIVKRWLAGN